MQKNMNQLVEALTGLIDERITAATQSLSYVSMREAADIIKCRWSILTEAIKSGDLPAKRQGKKYAIRVTDLHAWHARYRCKKIA